jgi:hypothetical protein
LTPAPSKLTADDGDLDALRSATRGIEETIVPLARSDQAAPVGRECLEPAPVTRRLKPKQP